VRPTAPDPAGNRDAGSPGWDDPVPSATPQPVPREAETDGHALSPSRCATSVGATHLPLLWVISCSTRSSADCPSAYMVERLFFFSHLKHRAPFLRNGSTQPAHNRVRRTSKRFRPSATETGPACRQRRFVYVPV